LSDRDAIAATAARTLAEQGAVEALAERLRRGSESCGRAGRAIAMLVGDVRRASLGASPASWKLSGGASL
jgi:hypothetical protein